MPRTGSGKHTPVLYPHPESGEIESSTDAPSPRPDMSRQTSPSSSSITPSTSRSNRTKPRSGNPYYTTSFASPSTSSTTSSIIGNVARPPDAPKRAAVVFSTFQRKYRPDPSEGADRQDPDANYFQRGLEQLNDPGDSDDDTVPKPSALAVSNGLLIPGSDMTSPDIESLSQAERERLEWQTMLASVLDGEVFRSEKTRIVRALETVEARSNTRHDIWLGIRAWLRGRSDSEELARLEDRRNRVVTAIYEEIMSFRVQAEMDQETGKSSYPAEEQVHDVLDRWDVACSLYTSFKAMQDDKPETASPELMDRLDALISWNKLQMSLQQQISALQKWTGSESLDVTKPNEPVEVSVVGENKESSERTGSTTFLERVLKEDSLQRTFEKDALVSIHVLIESARRVVTTRSEMFEELNLPSLENQLVQLISFPIKLIEASLHVRLESADRIQNPNSMVLDTMTDDIRLQIGLACTLKREYEALMEEDPDGKWKLPPSIPKGFDRVLLQSLLLFFKLLHWKLKGGAKGIYFKETDVLEAQEDLMDEVSMTVQGGSAVIAEQLCGLTNRLLHRIINYFETQVQVPVIRSRSRAGSTGTKNWRDAGKNSNEEETGSSDVVVWLSKVLESVRLRYRKLQRYARSLMQRFSNAAEYSLEGVNTELLITRLVATEHFMVLSDFYAEQGIYIVASPNLRAHPPLINEMLIKAYNVNRPVMDTASLATETISGDSAVEDLEDYGYILLLTPGEAFVWQGLVMVLQLTRVDLALEPLRIRLVADGPQNRFVSAKAQFTSCLTDDFSEASDVENDDSLGLAEAQADKVNLDPVMLHCLMEQLAHLPNVNRELRRITRATNKLAEIIVASVHNISDSLRGSEGYQELLENWFSFASDHGQHAQKHMEATVSPHFSRMMTKLAISWVAFICDDCDPTDRKTFRWAVNALEFAMLRTHGTNILHLPDDEFALLRQKVASCMTLLIGHFDILGARSSFEAKKEQERLAEIRRMDEFIGRSRGVNGGSSLPNSPITETEIENQSLRLRWEEPLKKVRELDAKRYEIDSQHRAVGRVVDEDKLEDKSLLFLASSTSNISIRWQQGRHIGSGAFGSVYLAVNLDTGGLMAAKEIKFQDMSNLTSFYQQIKDELSVMEMLQHPNIVEYYGIEVHRDKIFIFEEYCKGGSLASLLELGRIEDETVLQFYTIQMLEGLAYLHLRNVVHRDIKPDNILLDHNDTIKFVDFGAAKILAKGQHKSISRPSTSAPPPPWLDPGKRGINNSLTGTPMYMSPEVIKNDRRGAQGAMDIWSLGCVVLECATGRKAWSHLDNEWAILYQIGQADRGPQLPSTSELSPPGISFIKACLTLDPMRRPTAETLLEHPWIQSFRVQFQEIEQSIEGGPRPSTPTGGNPQATAQQGDIVEELETDDLMTNPIIRS
ncbi:uncharacterized protein EI90DRAFT_2970647 [Cantharellus anzutake]|uniref:uncharacterized protein n=1 Tax=Cantharellus anzutake TaxID=1750568 RepID=UPI001906AFCA|nr:uncharacterized protein EI90DRAFT_2970647 [Cantharellus anzutake]KAF8334242.1 hypothetical protein EI90DRAFT_2970647 [Cantharellus anzutake]